VKRGKEIETIQNNCDLTPIKQGERNEFEVHGRA
jgi:hypothetical protein